MSKEGTTVLYTGTEAQAWRVMETEREAFTERWGAVHDRHRDAETAGDLNRMMELLNAILNEHAVFIHARMTRVLPHLADVITYLLFAEYMETPEWVDQAGMPQPYTLPSRRRSES